MQEYYACLECADFLNVPAEYVLSTFSEWANLRLRFCRREDVPAGAGFISYRPDNQPIQTNEFRIHESEIAREFFQSKRAPLPLRSKIGFIENEKILIPFDDGTEINPDGTKSFHAPFDLIASAFYFLSGWQERYSTDRDQFDRFESTASLQNRMDAIDLPVVNQYFMILLSGLTHQSFRSLLGTPSQESTLIALTHDVDHLRKWTRGILFREVVRYGLLNEQSISFRKRMGRLAAFIRDFPASKDPFRRSIISMADAENRHGVRATYFFKTGVTNKRDAQYSLKSDFALGFFGRLLDDGHEIGLHPSFESYLSESVLRLEQSRLRTAVGDCGGVRQHYLRYRNPETSVLHEKLGFPYDSTLGFHDHEGFRNGYAGIFRVFDLDRWESMSIRELPLIMMDGTLQSYRMIPTADSLAVIENLLATVRRYRGTGAILFHNTVYDEFDFPGWGGIFEELLTSAPANGIHFGTAKSIIESWSTRDTKYNHR